MVFKGQKVESRHHFIADCFSAVLLVSAVFLVRIRLSEIFRIHLVSDELFTACESQVKVQQLIHI